MKKCKKITSLLLSLVLILSVFGINGIQAFAESGFKFDIDGDGYTTAVDALLVYRHITGIEYLPDDVDVDVNGDGRPSAADARLLLRYSAMLEKNENFAPVRRHLDTDRSGSATELIMSIDKKAAVGEYIKVTVSGKNMAGTGAGNLFLTYDNEMLEFVSIDETYLSRKIFQGDHLDVNTVAAAFAYHDSVQSDEDLLIVWFKVLKDGKSELVCEVGTWTGSDAPADTSIVIDVPEPVSFEYAVLSNGTAEITKYNGSVEVLDIPSEIGVYKVTSIGEDAFRSCYSLKSVTIPNSVVNIGEAAFFDCNSLENISIPDSVTSIGRYAFCYCRALKNVTIPSGVTSIGEGAFSSCESLESIIIPDGVKNLSDSVFSSCYSLQNIVLGNGLERIGDNTFYHCDKLTSIIIPDNVKDIGEEAFSDCTALESVSIGNGATNIGYQAFVGCISLKSITIPDSVKVIGGSAFSACTGLKNVKIGNGIKDIYDSVFSGCENLKTVEIPDSVKTIGKYAFRGCSELASITIPVSVETIGYYAFSDCDALKDVTILGSAVKIGEMALGYLFVPPFYNVARTKDFTIHGVRNSTAQDYASKNGFYFVPIELSDAELDIKESSDIIVNNSKNIVTIKDEQTIDSVKSQLNNKNVRIVDKNGKELESNIFAATGAKIQLLNDNNNIISEYTVLVLMDVSGDGRITAADARIALRVSAKLDSIEGVFYIAADANGDGNITSSDARKILRTAAGLEF